MISDFYFDPDEMLEAIKPLAAPAELVFPLSQHIGAPAKEAVAKGEEVLRGQVLGEAGGFVSVNTGNPQDANALPIPKQNADEAMDAAACIGCGGCVAACPNAAAMLWARRGLS